MALALVVTNAGRAALLNAQQDGTRAVRVAACGVSPTAIVATPAIAALPGEVKRIATLSGLAAAADIIHMLVRDETRDSYTVRSVALYLSDGTLFAACGGPDVILEKSAQAILLMPIDVKLADIAADRIEFGDAVFVSPPATTDLRGVVELATPAEAAEASDAHLAVTPAGLAGLVRVGAGQRSLAHDADLGILTQRGDGGGWSMVFGFVGAGGTYRGGFGAVGGGDALGYYYVGPAHDAANTLRVHQDRVSWGDAVLWHAANDGADSGLDADLLDGQQGSWYADVAARLGFTPVRQGGGPGQIAGTRVAIGFDGGFRLKAAADGIDLGNIVFDANVSDVWRVSNDGAGSGLDADLLDGQQGSWYADVAARLGFTPVRQGGGPGQIAGTRVAIGFDGGVRLKAAADGIDLGNIVFDANVSDVWRASNDGAGSGLDADLLDGWQRDEIRNWANLLDRPAAFPSAPHTHGAADIVGAFASRSFATDGYQMLPGGLILQWVAGAPDPARTERSQFVTFPLAFPNACFQAFPSTRISQTTISGDALYQIIGTPSVSGCTVLRQITGSTDDNASTTPLIFAIGF